MTPLMRHREKTGQKRMAVARALGINYAHLYRIELGQRKPSPELADRIALHFGNALTRDQILYPEDYTQLQEAS